MAHRLPLLISIPPTQTSLLLKPTPPSWKPQTHRLMPTASRKTSAGWLTIVSPWCQIGPLGQVQVFYRLGMMVKTQLFFSLCVSPVHSTLRSAYSSLSAERDRVRHTIDLKAPPPAQVMGLKAGYGSVSWVCLRESVCMCCVPQYCTCQVDFRRLFICQT